MKNSKQSTFSKANYSLQVEVLIVRISLVPQMNLIVVMHSFILITFADLQYSLK